MSSRAVLFASVALSLACSADRPTMRGVGAGAPRAQDPVVAAPPSAAPPSAAPPSAAPPSAAPPSAAPPSVEAEPPRAAPTPPARDERPMAAEPSRDGWNTAQIRWESYEDGLARARAENKPVLLVVSASWCSHCVIYSHVFEDAAIVERSRDLVMVRIDADRDRATASQYVVDGGYVPRTFFLSPDGTLRPEIDARRPRFRYFFDENDPRSLLAGMDTALGRATL